MGLAPENSYLHIPKEEQSCIYISLSVRVPELSSSGSGSLIVWGLKACHLAGSLE